MHLMIILFFEISSSNYSTNVESSSYTYKFVNPFVICNSLFYVEQLVPPLLESVGGMLNIVTWHRYMV